MIDRDQEMTRAQKERQKASLSEVLGYCTNKTDCRRVQVLAFFNETFNPNDCHRGCDICLNRELNATVFVAEDVTADACKALEMVQSFDRDDRITLRDAVNCFRGTRGNSAKGLNQNQHFGCGKSWDRGDAERLLQTLQIEKALEEYTMPNAAGWSNAYIKAGRNHDG